MGSKCLPAPFSIALLFDRIKRMKKTITTVILAGLLFVCCLPATPALAEAAQTQGFIAEPFSYSDARLDTASEPVWFDKQPAGLLLRYENGKLIMEGAGVVSCFFRIALNSMGQALLQAQKASGLGFYFENNTGLEVKMNLFLIGTSCIMVKNGGKFTFLNPEGRAETAQADNGIFTVAAGFRGYILAEYTQLWDAWQSRDFRPQQDIISSFGLYIEKAVFSRGQTLAADNFVFTGNVAPQSPLFPAAQSQVGSSSLFGTRTIWPGTPYMIGGGAGLLLVLLAFILYQNAGRLKRRASAWRAGRMAKKQPPAQGEELLGLLDMPPLPEKQKTQVNESVGVTIQIEYAEDNPANKPHVIKAVQGEELLELLKETDKKQLGGPVGELNTNME